MTPLHSRPFALWIVLMAFSGGLGREYVRRYRQEMIQFLRDRFPEIRQADDTAALNFARTKANAKYRRAQV